MKKYIYFTVLTAISLLSISCASIRTSYDYDTQTSFSKYKTFAFYKKGIDKARISDLDKRRILRALEKELLAKGLKKSKTPDLLISFFTKSKKRVNISNPDYYGYMWSPWWFYGANYHTYVSKYTEGTLFVDIIDASKKELVWQGVGAGALVTSGNPERKEQKIKEFVSEIMKKYPPKKK